MKGEDTMKSFLVSDHAEDKRFERGIRWEDIPHIKSLKTGIQKVVRKVRGRDLVAFYRITPSVIVLMTVYWRSQ